MPHGIFGNTLFQKPILKAWSYILVTPAAGLAVSLSDMKAWLKITSDTEDALITSLIESATLVGEQLTKLDFINKTYRTFRNNFSDFADVFGIRDEIVIRRSKLQSVTSVEYLKDTVLTPVASSVFYVTEESAFSRIIPFIEQQWPVSDVDDRDQAVKIVFIAGFGATEADIPSDIKLAIKLHVASAFENRGDCDDQKFMPMRSRNIYAGNRIMDITLG